MSDKPAAIVDPPHKGQPVLRAGEPIERARAAMIMVHGRGDRAQGILSLVNDLAHPGFAYLAPQANGNTWYPNSFLAPIPSNEPWLGSALAAIGGVLEGLEASGLAADRVILLGFSQGACLSLEYVARHARRYGGVAGLSGGVIGPPGTPRDYPGSVNGTPVFLGCSDIDPHIPKARVEESAEVFKRLGANVDLRLYPGMGHTVNEDELNAVRRIMESVVAG